MNNQKQQELDFWKMVNLETSEYESVNCMGAWREADTSRYDDDDD